MAWTNPITFTAATLTPAQMNTYLRDNLLETAPAKATTANRWFISTGANSLAERAILQDTITASQSTTSATYVDLATPGPTVTLTTSAQCLTFVQAQVNNTSVVTTSLASIAWSGATTQAAIDDTALYWQQPSGAASIDIRCSSVHKFVSLTPGSNTATIKYRVGGGTGNFQRRTLIALGM